MMGAGRFSFFILYLYYTTSSDFCQHLEEVLLEECSAALIVINLMGNLYHSHPYFGVLNKVSEERNSREILRHFERVDARVRFGVVRPRISGVRLSLRRAGPSRLIGHSACMVTGTRRPNLKGTLASVYL